MNIELNKVELDITREVLNIALSKAADSLSFFMKEDVMIRLLDVKIDSDHYTPISKKDGSSKVYLLTTDIKGELGGKSYLVFNEQEVEKLVKANLPQSILDDPEEREKMTEAVLLEADNIITASVVTQFANLFQCRLYGDVPRLDVMPSAGMNPFLMESNKALLKVMYVNARFVTKSSDTSPEFIWLMEDSFCLRVKALVKDEEKVQMLRQLNASLDA